MSTLEEIKIMKQRGIPEPEIIKSLQEKGIPYKDISESLAQSKITAAVEQPATEPKEDIPKEAIPQVPEPFQNPLKKQTPQTKQTTSKISPQ